MIQLKPETAQRRRFLRLAGGGMLLLPVAGLMACSGDKPAPAPAASAPEPAPAPAEPAAAVPGPGAPAPAGGADLPRLEESRPAHGPSSARSAPAGSPGGRPRRRASRAGRAPAAALVADGDDHAAAVAQLVHQRLRHVLRRGGDDDRVEGRLLRPAGVAVADADVDVVVAERASPRAPARRGARRSRSCRPRRPVRRAPPPGSRSRCRSRARGHPGRGCSACVMKATM
jgi:pyruvate dehydrogenase E2 component (dihydrolipoamide acetyltransferase)